MVKERVLVFNDNSERIALLSDSLSGMGYEVVVLDCLNGLEMQRQIYLYHPDYIVMDDDELIALRRH
ncbi:MAG: hypothetical protein OEZ43_14985 [Gammaproteobacteria bacterium]|nr:hypothetical protein [Gammaproteobacteria bacterium]